MLHCSEQLLINCLNMNEYSAKKLGEVLAFSEVGAETLIKGAGALSEVFNESVDQLIVEHQTQAEAIKKLATDENVSDGVLGKAEKTGAKLRAMRDLYLASEDDWADPAELHEWLGFFEGAAIVHFSLVKGAGEELENEALVEIASAGIQFHQNFLDTLERSIKEIGREKASA